MATRSELKQRARERRPPMGVFVIRNRRTGRFLIHAVVNLQAGINRLQVEITPSTNPNLALQRDWRELGPSAFEIRTLDVLEPKDAPGWTPGDDLAALAAMWRERLVAEGGTPY
jgi:hypothetical protein